MVGGPQLAMIADDVLDDLIAASAARWPGLHLERTELARALADRAIAADSRYGLDVGLMCGLARGDATALRVFEAEIVPDVRGALARLDPGGGLVEDALQQVRVKLLVAAGEPRIVEYRARGSLAAWVQVIAIRETLMLRRRTRNERPVSEDALLIAVEGNPALELTKQAHRADLAEAFQAALAALTPRERTLLRLCFVEATGTEQLAELYQVHRVTMFRWLTDARARLLDALRSELMSRVGVAASDVDSLIRALASSLDVAW